MSQDTTNSSPTAFDEAAEAKAADLPEENSLGQIQADIERFRDFVQRGRRRIGGVLAHFFRITINVISSC